MKANGTKEEMLLLIEESILKCKKMEGTKYYDFYLDNLKHQRNLLENAEFIGDSNAS